MNVTLLHGDCLTLLPTLPAASVDLICADLPYGTTACKWDSVIPLDKLWPEYRRVLKPRGACVLFGGQPFTSVLVMSNLAWFKYTLVWEKSRATNFLNSPNRPLTIHEDLVVFSPGTVANGSARRMTYNPQIDLTQPRWYKKVGLVPWNNAREHADSVYRRGGRGTVAPGTINSREGRLPKTVLSFPNPAYQGANQMHPTQKPLARRPCAPGARSSAWSAIPATSPWPRRGSPPPSPRSCRA